MPAQSNTLLPLLIARFGVKGALALLPFLDPSASGVSKGLAGGELAASGAQAAGSLTGSSGLAGAGKGLAELLGLASTGYDISKIASSDQPAKKKGGAISGDIANLIASLLVPYYGLGVAGKGIADLLRGSGSPQLRGAGKGMATAALPVEGLLGVLSGDRSPKAAFGNMAKTYTSNPLLGVIGSMDPIGGTILGALGIGEHTPTHGTVFKHGLQDLFSRLGIKGIKDWTGSDFTTEMFNAYPDRSARDAATVLGRLFAKGSSKPYDYGIQAQNILLNNLAPNQIMQLAKKYAAV